MSPQDSMLLQDFLNQLVQAGGVPKDPEAEAMIARAVARQPDAAYLLVQRALLQQQALENAQAEIAALQRQLRGGARATPEFLDPNAWGRGGGYQAAAGAQGGTASGSAAGYPAGAAQAYPSAGAPGWQQGQAGRGGFFGGRAGGMGGALGNIASTAAGVAAGAFLFQGLGHLLGGNHDGNGFLGNNEAFSSLTAPLEHLGDGGADSAGNLADSAVSEHDFSGGAGGDGLGGDSLRDDGFGDDGFSDDGFGGDDGMLG